MEIKYLSEKELFSLKEVKELKRLWYISATKEAYDNVFGIRLTDTQLAKLIASKYGGLESTHITNIRRTRCNDKSQSYIPKNV